MLYIIDQFNRKWIINIMFFLYSLIAVFAVNIILNDGSLRMSNSVFSVILFVWCYLSMKYAMYKCKYATWKFSFFFGISFSVAWVLGDNLATNDYSRFFSLSTWCKIAGVIPLFVALSRIFEEWLITLSIKNQIGNKNQVIKGKKYKSFILFWTLILVCWIPVWLAAFPGIYAYDAITQTAEFYLNTGLSGHHPIAHTAFLWGMITLGKKLFGTYEAGMGVYAFVQMLILSLVFAYVIYKIKEWKAPKLVYIVCLIIFMASPLHSVLAISATKDILFTGFFTLMVLYLMEFGLYTDTFMHSPGKIIRFILVVFAMAIFRNNGIYAFVCCIPFVIWVGKRYWKKVVALLLCCFTLYLGYMMPLSSLLGVESGNFREALSVPIQQLSRAMLYNEEELTENEKEKIAELIPDYDAYTPRISDSTKNTFQTDKMSSDKSGFVKLWIVVGLKCPVTYIDAFLSNSLGFWYPDMQYPDPGAFHAYIEYENTPYDFHTGGKYDIDDSFLLIERDSKIPFLNNILHKWAYSLIHQKIPVISMLFNIGTYSWMLICALLLSIIYKKWEMLPMCMVLFGLWLTCLLSPVVWLRYGYPLMTCFPLLLTVCVRCVSKEK